MDKHSPCGPVVKAQDMHLPSVDWLVVVLLSSSLHMQTCKLLGYPSAFFECF